MKSLDWIKDARHFQIIYLSGFLVYGIISLGWDADWIRYISILSGCLIVQAIGIHFTTKRYSGLKSAMITALGLCLIFKTNSISVALLAATIAIGAKFLIRFNNKHLFNPANLGIVMGVLLTGDAWISPGQWGNEALLIYFLGAAGLMILFKVGRLETSLSFLITFAALEYVRTVLYLGWEMDVFFHKIGNGTLLLFAFFMITDPVTTPNNKRARMAWAVGVAVISFFLTNWFYVHTAPVWALVVVSPITVILDRYFKGQRFQWYAPKHNIPTLS